MFGKEETHASWGMVGLYHTQGGERQLFGSDVSNHNTVVLKVKHAKKERSLGRDWTMGTDTICEVELSSLQFAELLTNMNVGDGVPCTVRYTRTDGCIQYKPETSKIDIIYKEANERADIALSSLYAAKREIESLVKNKKIPQYAGKELLYKLSNALSDLEGEGSAFYKKQATAEIDKMVVEAKSQISEYIAAKIYSVGLETLMNGADITPKLNGDIEENTERNG